MPPRRAPQPSKWQASANQQGPPICPSVECTKQKMGLICYLSEIFMHWDFIGWKYNWTLKLNWHRNIKRSQAKPNQPGMEWSQSWNAHCISYPRSRSMGPSVQNCYCFPWTFPILTDDLCLLSTQDKEARAHQIFWKIKSQSFEWDKVSLVCIPETWGRVSWIEIHPFDVSWNTSCRR